MLIDGHDGFDVFTDSQDRTWVSVRDEGIYDITAGGDFTAAPPTVGFDLGDLYGASGVAERNGRLYVAEVVRAAGDAGAIWDFTDVAPGNGLSTGTQHATGIPGSAMGLIGIGDQLLVTGHPTGCSGIHAVYEAAAGGDLSAATPFASGVRTFCYFVEELAYVHTCGDGIVRPNSGAEACDDGGESASCDEDCTAVSCGDSVVNGTAGEECDDGGESATCDDDCTAADCGDGAINATAGEACDDGGESATCDDDCTAVECGDGAINEAAGETCDDGGESATCDDDCTAAACGDGVVNETAGEECDGGDGCNDDCTLDGGTGGGGSGGGGSDTGGSGTGGSGGTGGAGSGGSGTGTGGSGTGAGGPTGTSTGTGTGGDGGGVDDGSATDDDDGCSCQVPSAPGGSRWVVAALGVALAAARRRRR